MKGYSTFFRLWIGQTVSGLGSQLTGFGLAVWVFQQTRSVTAMATIFMVAAIPGIVLSPFIGAIVDRIDRKKILLFADSFAGVFSLVLALVLTFGKLDLWLVYVVAGAGSVANTLMWPAMTATTSLLVPKEQLGRASGMTQFGDAGSIILSPILGGIVYGYFGLKGLVAVDVASFVFAIAMTLLCVVPKPAVTAEGAEVKPGFLSEAAYGFHFVFARPGLLVLMAYFMFTNLVLTVSNTLIAPIVLGRWDARTLGFIQSVTGVGMLLGTLLMAAWGGPKRKVDGFWIFGAAVFVASLLMLLPLSVFSLCASFFIMMIFGPVVNGCSQAIWQRKTPADVQGKVFAVRRMFAWFMTPLGFALVGPLADKVFEPQGHPAAWVHAASMGLIGPEPGGGHRSMFIVSGLLTLAASVFIFALPRFRHLEEELPDAELKAAVAEAAGDPAPVPA